MKTHRLSVHSAPNGAISFFSYQNNEEYMLVRKSLAFHVIVGRNHEFRLIFENHEATRSEAIELCVRFLSDSIYVDFGS